MDHPDEDKMDVCVAGKNSIWGGCSLSKLASFQNPKAKRKRRCSKFLSPFLKPVGNHICTWQASYTYLAKSLLQKLVYVWGIQSFQKNVSEDIIINKVSSSICPHYCTVKMYYELCDFFIIVIVFSSIMCFLQPSYTIVNWLIKNICWVH